MTSRTKLNNNDGLSVEGGVYINIDTFDLRVASDGAQAVSGCKLSQSRKVRGMNEYFR